MLKDNITKSCSPLKNISFSFCFSTFPSSELTATTLSCVSNLIRSEIYRIKTFSSVIPEKVINYEHGITCGALVWARAPPSAYWPGLVISVAENTVNVAW